MSTLPLQILGNFQMMMAGLFFCQSAIIFYFWRRFHGSEMKEILGLSTAAGAYCFMLGLAQFDFSIVACRFLQHLVWTSGCIFVSYYILAIERYVQTESRAIKWIYRFCFGVSVISGGLGLLYLFTGRMVLYSELPFDSDNPFLPAFVKRALSPNELTGVLGLGLFAAHLTASFIFIRHMMVKKMDRILTWGALIGCFAVLYEIVLAAFPLRYGFSLLFVSGFIESVRLGFLNMRRYRRRIQSVEHDQQFLELGRLSASIGHEINNCLAIALANTAMMSKLNPDCERTKNMTKILKRIDRLSRGMKNLAHRPEEDLIWFLADAVLDETVSLFDDLCKAHSVEIRFENSQCKILLYGDPASFQYLLMNLIRNSIESLEQSRGGQIKVSSEYRDENFNVSVQDNGPGVPAEIQSHLFDPYFTTKSSKKGTGQGLTFVHSKVNSWGGSIRCHQPKDYNQGAAFTMSFPPHAIRVGA